MDIALWALRVLTVVLAVLAGWMFGRSTPQWQEDAWNDTARGGTYSGYGSSGLHGGYGGGTAGCGIFAAMTGGGSRWVWSVLLIAAFITAAIAWPHPPGLRAGGRDPQFLFMQMAFWAPLISFALGYIPARLTDKGPVGPLE